jgi:hypothetical protein
MLLLLLIIAFLCNSETKKKLVKDDPGITDDTIIKEYSKVKYVTNLGKIDNYSKDTKDEINKESVVIEKDLSKT